MILAWPLVTVALFVQLPHRQAIVWSLLAGYLLLPVRTNWAIPVVIDLDKTSITELSTFLFAVAFARRRVPIVPREFLVLALCLIVAFSPLLTMFGNRDPLVFSSRTIPGMSYEDGFGAVQLNIAMLLPFVLGHAYLRDEMGHRIILTALAIAGLAYSLPMLLEIRLSPQLHRWIYGFFPHSFAQQMRGDSYRPVVFLGHGLLVAIFTAMAVVATAGLARLQRKLLDLPTALLVAYMCLILLLCRSFGALLIALMIVPVVMLTRSRTMKTVAACVGLVVLAYPVVRTTGLIAGGGFERIVAIVDSDRAASLAMRTRNEDALLAKAGERPLAGWGTWGRNRIFEKGYGSDLSITDGAWVSWLGSFGYIGYFSYFGLLCFGLIARHGRRGTPIPLATGALMLVLVVNLLDLIPNSSVSPLTWLIAGALCPSALRRKRPRSRSTGTGDAADAQGRASAEAVPAHVDIGTVTA